MRSQMAKWRKRHSANRHERQVRRAIDAVSPGTLQDEVRAFSQTQVNR